MGRGNTTYPNRNRNSGTRDLKGRIREFGRSNFMAAGPPALALIIAALIFSIQGQQDFRTGRESIGWLVSRGEVERTEVVCVKHINQRTSMTLSSSRTSCSAVVHYRYSVDGKKYSGKRFRIDVNGADVFRSSSGDREACEAWGREHYPAGRQVRVWFDPHSPGQAALEVGVSECTYVLLALAPLLFGIGCFFILLALPESHQPSLPRRLLYSLLAVLLVVGINLLALPEEVSEAVFFLQR